MDNENRTSENFTDMSNWSIVLNGNTTFDDFEYLNISELLNNFTSYYSRNVSDILKNTQWRIAIIIIYSVVMLFGFLENVTILWIFAKNKRLHTPTNIFILVLASSDVLLCTFNLPLQLHHTLTGEWVFGETLCKVIVPTYSVPVYMSSMAILTIAIHRYGLIVHPLRRQMSNKTAVLLVLAMASFCIILTIPMIIHMKVIDINVTLINFHKRLCTEYWRSRRLRQAYTVSTIAIQFFVPLFVTTFLHVQIGRTLNRRELKKSEKLGKQKTNNILIAIVVTFSMCWLPWNLFTLVLEFNPRLTPQRYFNLIDCSFKIVAMGSACINPFLYGWLNNNFRRHLGWHTPEAV